MLLRTHLALTVLVLTLFISQVNNKIPFLIVGLVATLLPDIDNGFSSIGKHKPFRFLQFFVRHRGIIHSFTFCIIVSIILSCFIPTISLAFFLGYGMHLFADSFTKEGIIPFWPFKKKSSGFIRTGSLSETSFFLFLVLFDLIAIVFKFL